MSKKWIDQATQIRKGEELHVANLEKYLLENLPELSGKLSIDQFPGGASNLTYLISLGDQQLVLRRPPFGSKVKSAHDMGREYRVLSTLSKSYNKAPTPLLYTEDETIIGAPFYIMERVQGVILRKAKGPASELAKEKIAAIANSLISTMVELHALDYQKIGLGNLGKPVGYVERQVVGWTKRYFKSKTDNFKEIEKTAEWLNNNIPTKSDAALIHNDFKHDNVVLDPKDLTKIIAILDWEMCTIGDPLMDLGTTLGYWPNANDPDILRMAISFPSALPGNPSRAEFVEKYLQESGRTADNIVFYYVFGLFKIAVIVQQIYYRYKKGLTQDPRFAHFNQLVNGMGIMAHQAILKNRIEDLF